MFKVEPHEARGALWWYHRIQKNALNLKPTYQRLDKVWPPTKKALLIDSMINGYDIPKLYLADFREVDSSLNETSHTYAVIDGKQRLEAISDFFGGKLRLNRGTYFRARSMMDIGGYNYIQLKREFPEAAELVEDYQLAMMSVYTNEIGRIEEMFVRLNSGVPITGAERRNAMLGIVPDLIRKTVTHEFFESLVSFNKGRLEHFNVAAKLLLIEFRNGFADTKANNLDRFVLDAISSDLQPYKDAYDRCISTLDKMADLFEEHDQLLARSGDIPVYYWMVRQKPDLSPFFRFFLEQFVRQLANNRVIERQDPELADRELSLYYTRSRTTNDKGSLEDRYKILLRRYSQSALVTST